MNLTKTLLMGTLAFGLIGCQFNNNNSVEVSPTIKVDGEYSGTIGQFNDNSSEAQPVKITLSANLTEGANVGTIDYPNLNCSGTLTLVDMEDNKKYVFQEVLEEEGDNCIEYDELILTIDEDGNNNWEWIGDDAESIDNGNIDRVEDSTPSPTPANNIDNETTPPSDGNSDNENTPPSDDNSDNESDTDVSSVVDTHLDFTVAKSNGLEDVSVSFNGLTVTVTTDASLSEVSSSTIAIYGNIKGKSTNALLKLNSNYPSGTKFVVKVYENSKLVGMSEELTLGGAYINFNDIL